MAHPRSPRRSPRRSLSRSPRRSLSRSRALPLAVAIALAVGAACAGDDGNNRAPLPAGAGGAATGPPLIVGMINTEGSVLGSFPELRRSTEAAVAYVNQELGGVHGRPLQLELCITDGTQARSQACATELLPKKPLVVLGGVDLAAGVPLLILWENGVPYVGATPILGRELTQPGSYLVAGGAPADLLGIAEYATGPLKAKKVGVVYLDLPGILSRAVEGAERVLRERGVTDVRIVAEKADAADLVPALSAAAAGNPDVIIAAFDGRGCTRIMQARHALGLTATMLYPSSCFSEAVLAAGGPGAEGAYLATGFLPYGDTTDPEVALYRDKLARYGDEGDLSALSQAGFSLVMILYRTLGAIDPGSLNPAAVGEAFAAARDAPGFMSHSYTCDGKRVIAMRAVCNPWVRIVRHQGGETTDAARRWVDGSGLLELLLS